jgi:hypothetical protein
MGIGPPTVAYAGRTDKAPNRAAVPIPGRAGPPGSRTTARTGNREGSPGAVALLIVSTRLIMKVPHSIPWMITPELSVVIGWMFFGAALYFAYGLLRPSWANAGGQMAGFLAYDLC